MNETTQISFIYSNLSTIYADGLVSKITLGCLLSCLSIFTVCGNILVLYAIQTEKNLRTVSNLFILSLAVADLSVGLFVMPLSATMVISGRWLFSSAVCKMWLSIDYVASTASIFNLVLLSLDRYWAVVFPLRYLRKRTRKRATIFILIVWFISILWAPAVIFWSYIAPQHSDVIKAHECDTAFRSNKTFKTLTALVNFYLPLLTMIVISCRIMVAIRSRSTMEFGRRLSSTTQKQMKQDRTLTVTSLRHENHENHASYTVDDAQSLVTFPVQPCGESIDENPSISINTVYPISTSRIEPGQCFCSTCQTCNGIEDDSLWELQSPEKSSSSPTSSSQKNFSFAQIRPISTIFSSTKKSKENDNPTFNTVNSPLNHSNATNKAKYPLVINSNHSTNIKSTSKIDKHILSKKSSNSSSFSDESLEKDNKHSNPKTKLLSKKPMLSDTSLPKNSCLRIPSIEPVTSNDKKNSVNKQLAQLSRSTRSKMNFGTFFNTLINPSNSSALQKELKAARQLGMLVGVFSVSWLPYFILFLVVAWCNDCVPETVFTASIWLGYLNSTVNPLIYPLCNAHFRRAFKNICYCQHAKTKLPNLNALRELQTLRTVGRRR